MAEIQITDEYNSQGGVGGTCYLCNASKRITDRPERIITTNLEVDYDAEPGVWPVKWLEFCETCVTEMAHLLGMVTEDEAAALQFHVEYLEKEKVELQDEVTQLQSEIKAFGTLQKYVQPVPKAAVK